MHEEVDGDTASRKSGRSAALSPFRSIDNSAQFSKSKAKIVSPKIKTDQLEGGSSERDLSESLDSSFELSKDLENEANIFVTMLTKSVTKKLTDSPRHSERHPVDDSLNGIAESHQS